MLRASDDIDILASQRPDPAFRRDVIEGLRAFPKTIPARWFYDLRGSELFEEITQLPEYYPTRAEREILQTAAGEIASRVGEGRAVVEFGSGSSAKTPLLLSAIAPAAYVPIDISGDFLRSSADDIRAQFPDVPVSEVEADFTLPIVLPKTIDRLPRLGFFPGSTIGNLIPVEAVDLLRAMAATLGDGAMLLIGIDRAKSPEVLVPAYDDSQGVTAAFNLNLVERINRELAGTVPIGSLRHYAAWNEDESRIEMHLQATDDLVFAVDGEPFRLTKGETIHTENSLKYSPAEARLLLRAGGWSPIADWTDKQGHFSVILAERRAAAPRP